MSKLEGRTINKVMFWKITSHVTFEMMMGKRFLLPFFVFLLEKGGEDCVWGWWAA
jgi:hypothetical protein